MSFIKTKNTIFMTKIFAFAAAFVALHCIFVLNGEDTELYRLLIGLASLFGGIVLMNFIFFYGDGEEFSLSSLLWLIPGGYLVVSGYTILGDVAEGWNGSGQWINELHMNVLFLIGALLIAAVFLKFKSPWKIRLCYGFSGLFLFAANLYVGYFISPDHYLLITILLEAISLLLFGFAAFLDVASCED